MAKPAEEEVIEFPAIRCSRHGQEPSGYIVCLHILTEKAFVAKFSEPTPASLGEVLCLLCSTTESPSLDLLKLICRQCMNDVLHGRE